MKDGKIERKEKAMKRQEKAKGDGIRVFLHMSPEDGAACAGAAPGRDKTPISIHPVWFFFSVVVFVFFSLPSHPLFSCISFHDKQEIHEYME